MMLLASEGIYFLNSIPEDEDSLIFFILSIIVSVISYSLTWNKIQKSVWQQIRKNAF